MSRKDYIRVCDCLQNLIVKSRQIVVGFDDVKPSLGSETYRNSLD